ncbi:hypothetical protein [Rhizobium grahamii]|uniref:hypothetical protein n=1 Tax=Rhizobium grahamii TaxID=1120045 RepID=UPI00159EDF50|nr:hypothetical protein [Rhizobium grahamii]
MTHAHLGNQGAEPETKGVVDHNSTFVFFAGANLSRFIPLLARWSIPEAVTGGQLATVK